MIGYGAAAIGHRGVIVSETGEIILEPAKMQSEPTGAAPRVGIVVAKRL